MRNYTDPMVSCPYDKAHKMPAPRLKWHLVKCKARIERANLGLPEYHCRYNYMHLFFTKEELESHEVQCEQEKENQKNERLDKQKMINQALTEHHSDISAGGEQPEDQNQKTDLFKAYRDGQVEQRFKRFENSRQDHVEQQIMRWDNSEPSENQDQKSNCDDPQNQDEIYENEIGSENYERFKKLPVEHQKTVKHRYFTALNSSCSTQETDESKNRKNSMIMPDGMQSKFQNPNHMQVSQFSENIGGISKILRKVLSFIQDPQVLAMIFVFVSYIIYSFGVFQKVFDVLPFGNYSSFDEQKFEV